MSLAPLKSMRRKLATLFLIVTLTPSTATFAARPDWEKLATVCNLLLSQPSGSASLFWVALKGDPVLKERSKLVQPELFGRPELRQFTQALADEMFSRIGLGGIAAPQVRVGLRIFVLRKSIMNPFNKNFAVFINPEVTPLGDEMGGGFETCLSTAKLCLVKRYKRVRVDYFTADGQSQTEIFTGVRARLVQHEYDHLNGVLISDRSKRAQPQAR